MKIARMQIENFRSIESAELSMDPLTACVGRNGAGKSTVLNALSAFYNLAGQFSEFDYFNCDTSRQIRIGITFSDLSEREREEFRSYLIGDYLAVTKVISTGGVVYRGIRSQIPEFAEIRQKSFRLAQAELRTLIGSGRYPQLTGTPRSQADLDSLLDQYESEHPDLLHAIESETQFLGPLNVGGGKLDKYTRFVRVPAVRDAVGELERKGAILQLIDILVLRSVNARPEVMELNAELERRFREIFSRENLTELNQIASDVTMLLQRYAPGCELELDFAAIQAPKVPSPQPLARMHEDNFRCPIDHSGHGLQRALIFALLEQLARIEATISGRSEPITGTGDQAEAPSDSPDLILAIEEPELFLHPPRSRFLAKTLLALSDSNGDSRTQVLYTTHSPHFVGLDRFDQIRLARKVESEGTKTKRTTYSSFDRSSAARELARVADAEPAGFTPESFAIHAAPVMTMHMNEGFFGDAAVVVEGLSDAAALTTLQEVMGARWDEKGIVVVPALGKSNIDRPVVVFRGFGIPTYFLFDGDADEDEDKKAGAAQSNRILLRLAGATIEDFPQTQVNALWAVFANDLEYELRAVDPEYFLEERTRIAREFGIKRASQTFKNPETTSVYVRRAYSNNKIPESVMRIVESISRLG